ncbi:MAG: hypothetical protein ACRCSN_02120 [Dermatophilaceae bacterium]
MDVTLVAALLAAGAAIASLVVNLIASGSKDRKDAHRQALEPELPQLAESIHSLVAMSSVLHQQLAAGREESAANWRTRTRAAKATMEAVRPRVRYSLSGLDDAFRVLIRVPDWVDHRQGGGNGQQILAAADRLAQALHRAIEESWRSGRSPTRAELAHVGREVGNLTRSNSRTADTADAVERWGATIRDPSE